MAQLSSLPSLRKLLSEATAQGATNLLPTLPVVAGMRMCAGTERSIWACPQGGGEGGTVSHGDGNPDDLDCLNGCLGPDGIQGTADDTIDRTCVHSIDQGAACHNEDSPSQVAIPQCRGGARGGACGGCALSLNFEQPVIFGCIDYYVKQRCCLDLPRCPSR